MAGRERKNTAVYRSVSFKKLGSWSANSSEDQQHKSEDLEAAGVALPPEPSNAEQPLATTNVSVSRKVSKISATTTAGLPTADPKRGSSTPHSSISPSIRQLTEKFSSNSGGGGGSARTRRASPGDGAAVTRGRSTLPRARGSRRDGSLSRKSFHEDSSGGYFQDSDTTTADSLTDNKVQKLHSGTDSLSGSDSERRSEKRIFTRLSTDSSSSSGKRDYSQINACSSDARKTLTTDEEEDVASRGVPPPCKSHRSYLSTHHSDFIPLHSDKWPSVTKIRQLFDERQGKATEQQKTDTYENIKAAGRGQLQELSPSESAPLSDRSDKLLPCSSANDASGLSLHNKCIVGAQSRESSASKETFCFGMDFNSKDYHRHCSNDEEADIETQSSNYNKVSGRNTLQSSSSSSRSCTGGSQYHRINPSPFRSHSPSTEAEAARKTPGTPGLTSDPNPDLQPPATSSWSRSLSLDTSSCSSSLQQPTVRERRDRQGVGLPRDSLHSSHSSSREPAPTSSSPSSAPAPDKAITSSSSTVAPSSEQRAPARVASPLSSRWRFSSGDEEEEHTRRRRGGGGGGWSVPSGPAPSLSYRGGERGATERGGSYLTRSKNGWWGAKGIGRSSGSEEDSPGSLGPHSREAVRRRSLRKKKKVSGAALATGRDDYDDHDGESEDSDSDMALTMEHLERHHQQNTGGEFAGTVSRSHSAREPSGHSNRARVQQWERISSPGTSTTLPGVSRVSKVNIPPFVSSPGGSRCSSRYSSTETLKEEGQASCANRAANPIFNTGEAGGSSSRTASSSMLSKTYHGNFTMYRSPSFGHGDNFSRNPVRVRPKIVPIVTPSPSVLARQGGISTGGVRGGENKVLKRTKSGEGVDDDDDKNRISMSNPDITSETMTLLSFLKSDLSELKVRKTSGGDRSGGVEGSSVYRMGSRTHGGTLLPSGRRPSLKDLTATLRRAKSFTYSDKPTTGVRCYLAGATSKRSSSEQQLDLEGEKDGGRVSVSDREVESDGGDFRVGRGQRMRDYGFDDDDGEVMPTPLQERYVQEARQVIRDICQMSTREEEDDDDDVDVRRTDDDLEDHCFQVKKTNEAKDKARVSIKDEARTDQEAEFKNTKDRDKHERERENRERERSERDGQSMQLEKLNTRGTEYREKAKRQSRETERALLKGDSEESMFYDRSVDELSGHESSLTDEGIVTEPETGPSDPSERSFMGSAGVNLGSRIPRDVLGQPVTAWKQSALHEMEGFKQEREDMTENSVSCTNRLNEVSVPPSLPLSARMAEGDSIIMDMSTTAGINNVSSTGEEINTNSAVLQGSAATGGGGGGGLEGPATPSAIRRRRKFSPSGNNNTGSDSSNGSNAESTIAAVGNGESTVYRSLSDPMPQRCCSVAEEGNNKFSSVDSNLLGSLSVKGGGGGASDASAVANLSEYKGSVASDLSVYSDGGLRDDAVRDYSGVIRSIVAEPGAMDRLMTDDHGNGKAPKKKSFSDPSRRSDAPLLSQIDPQFKGQSSSTQPISELDQPSQIPPSSSEPILSEQREELWQPEARPKHALPTESHHHANSSNKVKKVRSQSECTPLSDNHDDDDNDVIDEGGEDKEEEMRKFNFDLKLAEVLSPRMIRRPSRKRPNRLAHFFPHEDPFEPPERCSEGQEDDSDITPPLPPPTLQSKPKTRSKHVRHASEPATFIPISPPPQLQPLKEVDCLAVRATAKPQTLSKPPGDEAPSLEDVTQKYILELSSSERDTEGPGPLPAPRDGAGGSGSASEGPGETTTSGITEAGTQKKGTEDTPSTPIPQRTKPRVDMRKHVMMTLLDTEQSYVESLRTLIQGYMRPLKHPDGGSIVDPLLVDEMFFQIPEILEHHEDFLEQVAGCVGQWHDRQTVGHLLIQSFSKDTLANMYSAYIDNFLNAKDAVRIAKEAKPAFHKFLEQNMRENKEKQALGDLMIKPVQRIPRYELLVKDLLKHTPEDHPDHAFLLDAQRDIKRLAEKINKGRRSAEEAERETRVIQEIEAHIEGVEHILNPQRKFLRQEMVMEAKTVGGKKDRSLFLFSDLIICTTLKRKSGSLRRSSMSLYSAASVIDTSSKYKFLWKLPLEDVEVVKSSTQATNKESIQKMISRLDEDLSTLGQISKLSETLSFPHQSLDEVIKDLMASVHRELSEKQSLAFSMTFLPTKLEFTTASAESTFVFEFTSPDARSNFEQAFEEAKKKLAMNKDQWDPEFLKAIPIMKTRSGMQFSCASPSHSCPDSGCEVWVCNSDGYVGQVCLLNIKDEPTVEACIAVCSARIICIAAVPGLKGRERGSEPNPAPTSRPPGQQLHISISHSSLELTERPTGPGAELVPFDSDDTDDEDSPSPSSTLQSQASHSTISSSYGNDEGPGSKDMATETTSSEEEQEFPVASSYGAPGMLGVGGGSRAQTESPMDGRAMRRSSRGSFTRASLEDLLSIDPEAYQSSVWLGTEDGCIHVYQSSDNIRNRKNSMKMQHSASILCILYLDNKVFVSLANGEVIVYQREAGSFWDPQSSQTLVLGMPTSPVTKMVPVGGKLWCGSQNRVLIINTATLVQEHCFQVGTDSSRCVTCMVAYGQGVWLALQGSAQVKLYHAQTWESLTEVDVAPAVHKMLAGADAIIRQHKAACLRITALLACKDLLWIGTSAGVVLTLAIPAVSSGTGAGTLKSPLMPMGSAHGHTGHVRFLTSIELPEGFDMNFPPPTTDSTGNQSGSTVDGNLQRRDSARRRASAHIPPKTNHLVISGGDGYEDFRLTNSSETVGRDDSTNHLLLWRV
ncbi:rho guanine nucleotide exchange factor 17-like [Seriola aureovittata]|uniref:rho guanine nucleotide exchange factor 17-like n=1 Tax=Seriola aureovittata TaxID=2871759 RepID=UPI0024BDF931|nr:rho guanine nucleotide exchange factor 17-like [Seriola aureovittata]XP_056229562.1 rho guanine nucleotide exchange factor 17-like [Seriola aureovittata]